MLALKLSRGGDAPVEREVRADSASPEISHLGYTIKAIAITPYPRSNRKIPSEEFVATFTVTRWKRLRPRRASEASRAAARGGGAPRALK